MGWRRAIVTAKVRVVAFQIFQSLTRNFLPKGTALVLGHLEMSILEILWQNGESAVRDIIVYLNDGEDTPRAYTTAMTTMDRLYKKKILSRRKVDRAFYYSPLISREEFDKCRVQNLISGLLAVPGFSSDLLISCLVDAVDQHEPGMLDDLEEEIRKKRKELDAGASL